jgi:hypothetical protein
MEHDAAPIQQLRQIAAQVRSIVHIVDVDASDIELRKTVQSVSRNLEVARKFLQDYEIEDDARKQVRILYVGLERLEMLRKSILDASQHNIFGAVDVALLTAKLDQLIERLR